MRSARLLLALGGLALSACSSLPIVGGDDGEGAAAFAEQSALSARLSGSDARRLNDAVVTAITSDSPASWEGANASGAVAPGQFVLANLQIDPTSRIPAARGDLYIADAVETEQGLYVLTRNANVRSGPDTSFKAVHTLPSGAGVEVVGAVVKTPWNLVAAEGVIRGYIHRNLMIKAPGTELELAGGPRRRPQLCREYRQLIRVGRQSEQHEGVACEKNGRWVPAPPAPGEAGGPADLMGN